MTFREFLNEDWGPIGSTEPNQWSQERKNGIEFARKKVRSKYQIPDGDEPAAESPTKSPEQVMGKRRLRPT